MKVDWLCTWPASLSTSKLISDIDFAAFSIFAFFRISMYLFSWLIGSSNTTIFDRSFTPTTSRKVLELLSLSLYIIFWSSWCSPVGPVNIFFNSPVTWPKDYNLNLSKFQKWIEHRKLKYISYLPKVAWELIRISW